MYYTYIARCSDGSLYTGYCRNPKEREEKHNLGLASKYTRTRRPLQIVYFEEHLNRSDAMKREAEIKRWSKEKKEEFILSRHKRVLIENLQ